MFTLLNRKKTLRINRFLNLWSVHAGSLSLKGIHTIQHKIVFLRFNGVKVKHLVSLLSLHVFQYFAQLCHKNIKKMH